MDGALIPNVEAVGVSKRFPGVLAVDGVDMAVRPGEARALAGQNGSGKSTLIKIVAGVYRPDAGTVKVGETSVAFRSPPEAVAAGISTIHQEVNLIPPRSVAENLFLAREPKRGPFIDQRRLVRDSEEILARYGLESVDPNAEVGRLSIAVADGCHRARGVAGRPARHHGRAHLAGDRRSGTALRHHRAASGRAALGAVRQPQATVLRDGGSCSTVRLPSWTARAS